MISEKEAEQLLKSESLPVNINLRTRLCGMKPDIESLERETEMGLIVPKNGDMYSVEEYDRDEDGNIIRAFVNSYVWAGQWILIGNEEPLTEEESLTYDPETGELIEKEEPPKGMTEDDWKLCEQSIRDEMRQAASEMLRKT